MTASKLQSPLVCLVTGANRGIGYETCRQLAKLGHRVILSSRDPQKGHAAASKLAENYDQIDYRQLDVTDPDSIERLYGWINAEIGRLDVLVNNAAVYPDEGVSVLAVSPHVFRTTFDINFFGPLALCQRFVPMMRRNGFGRVVNVSSGYGSISRIGGLTGAYKTSKVALNALTRVLAGELQNSNVKVNAADPGWVNTEMGGPHAPRTAEQGADTIVWLATLPDDGPTNGFFYERQPAEW